MEDCWPNYLKCASRFEPALWPDSGQPFRPNYTFLAWPRSIPWEMSRDWQAGGSTMYGLVAPKYQRSVCYAWHEPETCNLLAHDCRRSGHSKTAAACMSTIFSTFQTFSDRARILFPQGLTREFFSSGSAERICLPYSCAGQQTLEFSCSSQKVLTCLSNGSSAWMPLAPGYDR